MSLPRTVTLTRDGGNYWRAQAFRIAVGWLSFPFVAVALLVAGLNPFWFRNNLFNWVLETLDRFVRWIGYRQYAIYLGTDPKVWHTIKGDSQ